MSLLRAVINANIKLSRAFDSLYSERFRIDGNYDFAHNLVDKYLSKSACVYDVGGGKRPWMSAEKKNSFNSRLIGIDISAEELNAAPAGVYDEVYAKDICDYKGTSDGDLVVCQAVLEHVADVEAAISSISSCLKPGGIACIFVPSRNALFARLNMILPENIKRKLLFAIFPSVKHVQGFKSYYDRCTPKEFEKMASTHGFDVVELRCYYISSYFSFFFPLYVLWRAWISAFFFIDKKQSAETFSFVFRKRGSSDLVKSVELEPVTQSTSNVGSAT